MKRISCECKLKKMAPQLAARIYGLPHVLEVEQLKEGFSAAVSEGAEIARFSPTMQTASRTVAATSLLDAEDALVLQAVDPRSSDGTRRSLAAGLELVVLSVSHVALLKLVSRQ